MGRRSKELAGNTCERSIVRMGTPINKEIIVCPPDKRSQIPLLPSLPAMDGVAFEVFDEAAKIEYGKDGNNGTNGKGLRHENFRLVRYFRLFLILSLLIIPSTVFKGTTNR